MMAPVDGSGCCPACTARVANESFRSSSPMRVMERRGRGDNRNVTGIRVARQAIGLKHVRADGTLGPMSPPLVTCLVVDDEPPVRHAMVRVLEGAGYRVLSADSGPAAIATLEREAIDLVVSDLQMPGMDGVQLL